VAELEVNTLSNYFLETDDWHQLIGDEVDIVYGAKGSGKSALYNLLYSKSDELKSSGVLICTAENVQGDPVFKSLPSDPPKSDNEFSALWRIYALSLLGKTLERLNSNNVQAVEFLRRVRDIGLIPQKDSLEFLAKNAISWVKRLFNPSGVESTLKMDPNTGQVTGITGKLNFGELKDATPDDINTDTNELLELADKALGALGLRVWILFDRLDVTFAGDLDLEARALRALFQTYLSAQNRTNIRFKIFLRNDIWSRITQVGFREASHLERSLTISWSRASLQNLLVRRLTTSEILIEHYNSENPFLNEEGDSKYLLRHDILLTTASQQRFFNTIFPTQVEIGENKPSTINWMITRTQDSSQKPAPREVIQLLIIMRRQQINQIEIGGDIPEPPNIFSRNIFKPALSSVSQTRLEKNFYSEYPNHKPYVEKLKGEKSNQNVKSLMTAWKTSHEETISLAKQLTELGFFEERGGPEDFSYWVPFLYRDALNLSQGTAE
jgi:hypothetical protein